MNRHARLQDFARRVAQASPDMPVYYHPHAGIYLPIHPFGDEPTVLARLHLPPDACRIVDAYWQYHDDVLFVETIVAADIRRPRGVYARSRSVRDRDITILAVVPAPWITRREFESILTRVALSDIFAEQPPLPLTTTFRLLTG